MAKVGFSLSLFLSVSASYKSMLAKFNGRMLHFFDSGNGAIAIERTLSLICETDFDEVMWWLQAIDGSRMRPPG